jgi:5'-methylthioadenosine phosphorylase
LATGLAKKSASQSTAHRVPCETGCDHALETAIITAPDARSPELVAKLDAILARVMGEQDA